MPSLDIFNIFNFHSFLTVNREPTTVNGYKYFFSYECSPEHTAGLFSNIFRRRDQKAGFLPGCLCEGS